MNTSLEQRRARLDAKKLEHAAALETRRAEIHRHKQSAGSKILLWMNRKISGFGFVGLLGCKSRPALPQPHAPLVTFTELQM